MELFGAENGVRQKSGDGGKVAGDVDAQRRPLSSVEGLKTPRCRGWFAYRASRIRELGVARWRRSNTARKTLSVLETMVAVGGGWRDIK